MIGLASRVQPWMTIFQWFHLCHQPYQSLPVDVETGKSGHGVPFWAPSAAQSSPGFVVFVLPAASTCQSWSQVTAPWTTQWCGKSTMEDLAKGTESVSLRDGQNLLMNIPIARYKLDSLHIVMWTYLWVYHIGILFCLQRCNTDVGIIEQCHAGCWELVKFGFH